MGNAPNLEGVYSQFSGQFGVKLSKMLLFINRKNFRGQIDSSKLDIMGINRSEMLRGVQ
ncbi:hypothetical protein T4C_9866 [Trichinella pseudospiralis]|uniref:Uncharacterized protein n=1 Tax=Trichinella pseudospiralis TaxID=6337 RepID=A0A0V1JLK1_TRIPS|nr:hypothetical protein T4C_9866 [Trichinella pseudospiralis]